MSRLGWFLAGIGLGALGLAQFRDNPKAREAVDEMVAAAKDFTDALVQGYEERETELAKPAAKPRAAAKPAAKTAPKRAAKPAAKK